MRSAALLLLCAASSIGWAAPEPWQALFNGQNLAGWTPKIRGLPAGEDPLQTFRVEAGLLTVSYEHYAAFDDRFGHLFYQHPYSHYRLRLQYRFVGSQAPGGETWATKNSGVMLHSQAPESMPAAQDFPISIEVQFLGGTEAGTARPTANLCTPGTHVVYQDRLTETHCLASRAPTFYGNEWVSIEVLVRGSEQVVHYVDGTPVLEYGGLVTGGGVVSGHDPTLKPEGQPLARGYIALQSESHPIQFRRIELLPLQPTDPLATPDAVQH